VKASSWCSGLTNVSDTTDMETDFPAHGIMSLDDALKEFERLAAFRPVCRRGKQGNTKLESSMSNEDVLSDAQRLSGGTLIETKKRNSFS